MSSKMNKQIEEKILAIANAKYNTYSDEAAERCSLEGYPSHGSNYDLRMEGVWEQELVDAIDAIDPKNFYQWCDKFNIDEKYYM